MPFAHNISPKKTLEGFIGGFMGSVLCAGILSLCFKIPIEHHNWRWIFYVNLPIGILDLVLISLFIRDPDFLVRERSKIDYLGLLFMVVGLGAFQVFWQKEKTKTGLHHPISLVWR